MSLIEFVQAFANSNPQMRGTIVQLLEDARRGELDGKDFLTALASFLELFTNSADEPQSRHVRRSGVYEEDKDLRSAIEALVGFLTKLKMNQIIPSAFLDVEIEYTRSSINQREIPNACLFRGLDSLTQIILQVPNTQPLQRWSHVICAANFCIRSLRDLEPRSIPVRSSESDLNSIQPKRSPAEAGKEHQKISHHASLGYLLDDVYGLQEDLREDISMPGYKRALANWSRLFQSLISETPQSQEFRSRLSTTQVNSARLLFEFWDGCIDSKRFSTAAFEALDRAAKSGLLPIDFLSDDVVRDFGGSNATREECNKYYVRNQTLFGPRGPPYRWTLFRLFQVEFLPTNCDSSLSDSPFILSAARKMAAKIASSQRIAMSCYKSLLSMSGLGILAEDNEDHTSEQPDPSDVNLELKIQPLAIKDSMNNSESSKEIHSSGSHSPYAFTKKADMTDSQYTSFQAFLHGERDSKIGASVSACEWLEESKSNDGLPYYLWDVSQQKTIMTEGLDSQVEYTAISHTWGRWRKRTCPPVQVPGVDEWLIPQNSKFEVPNLPAILGLVPFKTPYIWFDLVCIPQETNDNTLAAIAKQEIGRQAMIFRKAKYASAWFNEIVDWKGVRAAIHRLSVNFLQEPRGSGRSIPQLVLDFITQDSELNLELFDTAEASTAEPESAMNGWFSSLWTLQELCLRPDMRMCSCGWEILSVGETSVAIDDLIALSEGGNFPQDNPLSTAPDQVVYSTNYISPRSTATDQLAELLDLSGLEHLLNTSRATILILGNQRYCRKNRAEAIMSAINVVDWYKTLKTEDRPSETNQYPIAFLREASRKIGAAFYSSAFGEGEILEILLPSLKPLGEREAIGTMLPFTPSRLSRAPGFAEGYTGGDHPSIASWTIQPDFSVEILQAGIVSYTGQARSEPRVIWCTIIGPSSSDPPSLLVVEQKGVDLDAWIDSFLPTTRNFAVCLHCGYGAGMSDGLLLKELSSGELVRIGTYCVTITKISRQINPPSSDVDWLVL